MSSVKQRKLLIWAFTFAGVLWLLSGLRDVFDPRFLSIDGHRQPGILSVSVNFFVGISLLVMAMVKRKKQKQIIPKIP